MELNPLQQEHCDALNNVLASIGPALELAQACKDCGWNVDDYIQQLKDQQVMAIKTKAKFFPHCS
mgnify:CR=1 FL=1